MVANKRIVKVFSKDWPAIKVSSRKERKVSEKSGHLHNQQS